jgi:hypothetical protein
MSPGGVPRVPAPVHIEVFEDRFDKSKIYGPGEIVEKMEALAEQMIVDEVAEEGTVGAASRAHGTSRGKY